MHSSVFVLHHIIKYLISAAGWSSFLVEWTPKTRWVTLILYLVDVVLIKFHIIMYAVHFITSCPKFSNNMHPILHFLLRHVNKEDLCEHIQRDIKYILQSWGAVGGVNRGKFEKGNMWSEMPPSYRNRGQLNIWGSMQPPKPHFWDYLFYIFLLFS